MAKKSIEQFVQFLLNNKNLNSKQKSEVARLLVRDVISVGNLAYSGSSIHKKNVSIPEYSDTETIFRFLHLFNEKEALKYTTHTWERSVDTGDYIFTDFSSFKKQYTEILDKWEKKINVIRNTELWMLVRNFLQNEDAQFYWGEHQIKVGYNKYVANWMNRNPKNQPFSMPLSEFPSSIRPGLINNRSLNSFNDVVELFKHSIEFRDNDLYSAVKKIFKNKSFNLDKEKMSSFKGVTFYTHTQKVKCALEIIAGNIFNRTEFPNLEVSCTTLSGETRNSIRIEILQVGSFSNKDINDPKVLGSIPDGDFASIKKALHNLCDFSVESYFKRDGVCCPLRINYLISGNKKSPDFEDICEDSCLGFKYILTFYTYNI